MTVFTNAGEAHTVDLWDTDTYWLGIGTGTSITEAKTLTAIGTEVETRDQTTDSQPAADQFQMIGTITATASRAVTEIAIFDAASAGNMLIYDEFDEAPINLATDDSIQVTVTIEFA